MKSREKGGSVINRVLAPLTQIRILVPQPDTNPGDYDDIFIIPYFVKYGRPPYGSQPMTFEAGPSSVKVMVYGFLYREGTSPDPENDKNPAAW